MSAGLFIVIACLAGFLVGVVFVLAFWEKFKGH